MHYFTRLHLRCALHFSMGSVPRAVVPVVATALLLGACSSLTRVPPPHPVAAPAQYKEAGDWQKAAKDAPAVPDAWWTIFDDPVLNELEQRVMVGNENLKSTLAALISARAALQGSQSANQPTLSVGLSGTNSGNSTTTTLGSTTTTTTTTSSTNSVSLTGTASWELDVWGRLAQSTTSAQALVQASANDLAAAQLSVQSTLAQSYFSLRTVEAQQALMERSVEAYQKALELTHVRYQGGVAQLSDELQAKTQLNTAQAQLADYVAQRAQMEHAIAVLLGLPPSGFTVARTAKLPPTVEVPASLPSTLLERRPDIAAAERRVASAYALIGVADAAYFPSLTLSATGGYGQSTLPALFSAPNMVWSAGASLTEAIFDAGARKQASAQARASADQAASAYRQLVLTGLQEVEDNLILARQLRDEVRLQKQALESAQRTLEITMDQYRSGTVSYLNVVTAQTTAWVSETTLLNSRNRELAAATLLLKNIAGRWQDASAIPETAPNAGTEPRK